MSYKKTMKKLDLSFFFCENSDTLPSNGSSSGCHKAHQMQMSPFGGGATEEQTNSQIPFHRVHKKFYKPPLWSLIYVSPTKGTRQCLGTWTF